MYRISELGERVGLSRTTLLYYEKLGLICGERSNNGYRLYSDMDVQRLRLVQQLQSGGLTLKECKACLEVKIERQLLSERLAQLDEDIAQKQQSRDLLAALLGERSLNDWHEMLDKVAPDAHIDWLIKQGFSETDAQRLRWLSKDMNTHEVYMADFYRVFDALERRGPGSEFDSLTALQKVPFKAKHILEVGCGLGIATRVLAQQCDAEIIAIDNDADAISELQTTHQAYADKVRFECASMTDLPYATQSFDLIWSEGSAYIMGVNNAFKQWLPFLSDGGVMVLSDLVWATDSPSADNQAFWSSEYPDMTTVEARIAQAKAAGYQLIDSFPITDAAWEAYYQPLATQVASLKEQMSGSQAIKDIEREIKAYRQRNGEFDYQMFILQKA
ncbi:MerR family transcriptional regulator [Vibrio renipiscarius]|uniref:Methyltransferase n=1 Tax=Vibrio renipiscarius TaxID=1461322 RepID=A0A0C2JJK1_9VIBR|nr:MerR family transcriptional regulator [Vibrio renipiscarius]KII76353.1 methyltransferase [Vibrio renipiscarius]KII78124.1 methyltransferase [Vibrio renipiscarius]